MNVTVARIDDRLIHGQIVTAWIAYANAKVILVADDKAASDATQQMLLKLAVPGNITLHIKTIHDACLLCKEDKSNEETLLIMRNPAEALRLLEGGFCIDIINLGNISNFKSDTGRIRVLDYLYVEQGDVDALRAILSRGVKLEVRAVPSEKSKNIADLLDKHFKNNEEVWS
jgi:mannose/fructose/N-acetylgalactosamine-specific phosphotransferase system component IIB